MQLSCVPQWVYYQGILHLKVWTDVLSVVAKRVYRLHRLFHSSGEDLCWYLLRFLDRVRLAEMVCSIFHLLHRWLGVLLSDTVAVRNRQEL